MSGQELSLRIVKAFNEALHLIKGFDSNIVHRKFNKATLPLALALYSEIRENTSLMRNIFWLWAVYFQLILCGGGGLYLLHSNYGQ